MACVPSGGNLSGKNVATIRLDYLLHFAVYLAICLYFIIGRKYGLELFNRNPLIKFIIAIILLTSATEILQLVVASRTFNIFDWIANLAGAATGLLLVAFLRPGL